MIIKYKKIIVSLLHVHVHVDIKCNTMYMYIHKKLYLDCTAKLIKLNPFELQIKLVQFKQVLQITKVQNTLILILRDFKKCLAKTGLQINQGSV